MIHAVFSGDKIFSSSADAFALNDKSNLGEKINNKIEYSYAEALFLVQENKLALFSSNKRMTEDQVIRKLNKKDKNIEIKTIVFKDLKKKGYTLKSALKFGADFRVYSPGVKPGKEHARWLLFATKDHNLLKWQDFAAKNRIAHSTKKKLLIAIVDQESDVSYYEVSWTRP